MLKLDAVIKDIKDVNLMGDAWIYDDNGNIKDDVICGNVLPGGAHDVGWVDCLVG